MGGVRNLGNVFWEMLSCTVNDLPKQVLFWHRNNYNLSSGKKCFICKAEIPVMLWPDSEEPIMAWVGIESIENKWCFLCENCLKNLPPDNSCPNNITLAGLIGAIDYDPCPNRQG